MAVLPSVVLCNVAQLRAAGAARCNRAQRGCKPRTPTFVLTIKMKRMKVKNKKFPQWRDKPGMRAMAPEAGMRGDVTLIRSG